MHAELSLTAPDASPAASQNELTPSWFLILNYIIQVVVTPHKGLTMTVVIIADSLYKIWLSFFFTWFFFDDFCQLLFNDYLFFLVRFVIFFNNDFFFSLLGDLLLFFLYNNDFRLPISYRYPLFLRRFWLTAMVMVSRCGILYYTLSRLMRSTWGDMRALWVISNYNDISTGIITCRRSHFRRIRWYRLRFTRWCNFVRHNDLSVLLLIAWDYDRLRWWLLYWVLRPMNTLAIILY